MAVNRGLTYPLTLENGGLKTSEDLDLLREAIYSVLETRPFERVMQPLYGTPDLVFNAFSTAAIVAEQIRLSLESQIDGPDFEVSGTLEEDGSYSLTVGWSLNQIPQPPIEYRLRV